MTNSTSNQPQSATTVDPFRFGYRLVWQRNKQGQMAQVEVPLTFADVLHPQEEDVLLHNPAHDVDCNYLRNALTLALNGREGVLVLMDVRIDWGVSDLKPHCPDLTVFANVDKSFNKSQGTFVVREVEATPLLVIEVTSPSTRSHDLDTKVMEYFKAGIPLYAIVDYYPELDSRHPHILGYRATPDGYLRVPLDEQGRMWLDPVKLWLGVKDDQAVCYYEDGTTVPTVQELGRTVKQLDARSEELQTLAEDAIAARQEALKKLDEEIRQRKSAEDTLSRLSAQLAELQAKLGEAQ